jgi:Tol biopolymer transport system component
MNSRILQLFIVITITVPMPAQEPVRQAIASQQKQTGLTLATFSRVLETHDFASRTSEERKIQIAHGIPLEGAPSRDGEYIAFGLSVDHPYRTYLAIVHSDGSGLREFPDVVSPFHFCWSYDKSKMALNVALRRQPFGELVILELNSKATQELEASARVTSQCWSPDNKQIVYGVGSSIRIYDLQEKKWHELAQGKDPAWSPDGNWIAFRDGDSYYTIRPSGAERKLLFKTFFARSGPWWSPDGAVVAYQCVDKKMPKHSEFATRQLRVRRLSDNSDDWVAEGSDVDYVPSYQWILPAQPKMR